MKLFEKDGHVHTPFCPHRYTDDPLEDYVKAAEEAGIKELAFTEHIPMVVDPLPTPTPITFRNPDIDGMMEYFKKTKEFRDNYKGDVKIVIGVEVDYLEGYEEKTREMMEIVGPYAEEILLSVHYLKIDGLFYYIANKDYVAKAVEGAGGADKLNKIYYDTVFKSLAADLGPYKANRIAHTPMIRLAHKTYPEFNEDPEVLEKLAIEIKKGGYSVDLNMQGLRNETCQEIFGVPLLPYIKKYDIPVVLGSDSHRASSIGVGFDHPSIVENLSWLRPEWVESDK